MTENKNSDTCICNTPQTQKTQTTHTPVYPATVRRIPTARETKIHMNEPNWVGRTPVTDPGGREKACCLKGPQWISGSRRNHTTWRGQRWSRRCTHFIQRSNGPSPPGPLSWSRPRIQRKDDTASCADNLGEAARTRTAPSRTALRPGDPVLSSRCESDIPYGFCMSLWGHCTNLYCCTQ